MDKEALFQAVIDKTPGWQDMVDAAWACLSLDDHARILILMQ